MSHSDGWANAKKVFVDAGQVADASHLGDWATYVSETVYEDHNSINGIQGNVTMRGNPNYDVLNVNDRMGDNGEDNKLAYLAGAIRMCMNRNRDENANGKIDEEELKWYLPASEQMDLMSLCHYSLTDPLFNFNQFFAAAPDANHQRLPVTDIRGKYLYKYHFATSDHYVYATEEFMNAAGYSYVSGNTASHAFDMRCVRNLNDEDTSTNPITPASKNVKTPSADNVKVFTFTETSRQQGQKTIYDRVFTMNKLDSRSLRNEIYVNHELPSPHYLFSRDNLPYKKFKVASDNDQLLAIVNSVNQNYRPYLKNIIDLSPCANYKQDEGDVYGSWRAPNAAEMGLMMMQLRASNAAESQGYYQDSENKFFWSDNTVYPYSGTSWNYTGPWGRVIGAKYNSGKWKLYFSDTSLYGSNANKSWPNKEYDEEFVTIDPQKPYQWGTTGGKSFIIRCVKDLAE